MRRFACVLLVAALTACGTGRPSSVTPAVSGTASASPDSSLSGSYSSSVDPTPPTTATPSATGSPSPGDPAFPAAVYPPPVAATPRPWKLTGGCPDISSLPHLMSAEQLNAKLDDYEPAIRGQASPYARADRALWPAIAAATQTAVPTGPIDLGEYDVTWAKGAPDAPEIQLRCGTDTLLASAFVTVGLSAAPADRGYAFFVVRDGHPLVYAVRNLPVTGPWVAHVPQPGRVLDTKSFTLQPTVIVSRAQLADAVGSGNWDWRFAATTDRIFLVHGAGPNHEVDGHGAVAALDRRTGAVLWRTQIPGCDSRVATAGGHVWVSPMCGEPGVSAVSRMVAEYDGATGLLLHRYATVSQILIPDGDASWMIASSDSALPHLLRLHDGTMRDLATLPNSAFVGGGDAMRVLGANLLVAVATTDGSGVTLHTIEKSSAADYAAATTPSGFYGFVPGDGPAFAQVVHDNAPAGAAIDPCTGTMGRAVGAAARCVAGNTRLLWCIYRGAQLADRSFAIAYSHDGTILGGGAVADDPRGIALAGDDLVVADGNQLMAYTP